MPPRYFEGPRARTPKLTKHPPPKPNLQSSPFRTTHAFTWPGYLSPQSWSLLIPSRIIYPQTIFAASHNRAFPTAFSSTMKPAFRSFKIRCLGPTGNDLEWAYTQKPSFTSIHKAPVELLLVSLLQTLLSGVLKNNAATSVTLQTSGCFKSRDIAACTTVATVDYSRGHFKLESSTGPQSKVLCMPQIVTLKPLGSHKIEESWVKHKNQR